MEVVRLEQTLTTTIVGKRSKIYGCRCSRPAHNAARHSESVRGERGRERMSITTVRRNLRMFSQTSGEPQVLVRNGSANEMHVVINL